MNTEEEIRQAYSDYRKTQFGGKHYHVCIYIYYVYKNIVYVRNSILYTDRNIIYILLLVYA